jgi:hypothetical protein
MGLRRTTLVLLALLLVGVAGAVAACKDDSAGTTSTSQQSATSASDQTTTSLAATTTTTEARGASVVLLKIGEVADVEQGQLSVDKFTVTDDLASDVANALLLTGDTGEVKNTSTKPAAGHEFMLITFKYKKAAYYDMRGGLYPDDIVLKNAGGTVYKPVETHGYGGIFESNAGKVKPDVEALTTAVFEVPKGETGLNLVYHQRAIDGFTCAIR